MGKYKKIISGIMLVVFMTLTFAPNAKAGFVIEALGGSFTYSAKTGKVTVSLNNMSAQLWKGKTTAKIGSKTKTIKASPYLTKSGVLMIPANMLSDHFGYKTTWDSRSKSLTIIQK